MSTVRYKCSNRHVWVVRPPLGRRPARWLFCEICGLSAVSEIHIEQSEPLADKDGTPLAHGDIVEFHFSAWPQMSCQDEDTRMVDIVERIEGWMYFTCPALRGSGAYAYRFAGICTRLGHISELNEENMPLLRKIGAEDLAHITDYLGEEGCRK